MDRRNSLDIEISAQQPKNSVRQELDSHSHQDVSSSDADDGSTSKNYARVAGDDEIAPRVAYPTSRAAGLTILGDCVSIGLPLAYILFVVMLWRLDGSRVTDSTQQAWENWITVLATVFPIMFAAIVSRSVSEAIRWKLERGATAGFLEQLMGSRTVGATVLTSLRLRPINFLSAILVITAASSKWTTRATGNLETLRYFSALYSSLVMAPEETKLRPLDTWGNVKIPFLNHEGTTWEDVPLNSSEVRYSSLAGIPATNLNNGNSTFNLESTYVDLRCDPGNFRNVHDTTPFAEFPEDFYSFFDHYVLANYSSNTVDPSLVDLPNDTWHGYNFSRDGADKVTTWSLALDRFSGPQAGLWPLLQRPWDVRDATGIEAGPLSLFFLAERTPTVGNLRFYPNRIKATCGVTQKYVESRVACTSHGPGSTKAGCRVVAQRPSQRRHAPENISFLSSPRLFNVLSRELPTIAGGNRNERTDYSLYSNVAV